MIYTTAFTFDVSLTSASNVEVEKFLTAIQKLITGDEAGFLKDPFVKVANTFAQIKAYPDKRYFFVGRVIDKALTAAEGDVTLWFKKEHPLYANHFIFVGLRVAKSPNSARWVVTVDMAEDYLNGVVVNRQQAYNTGISLNQASYWDTNTANYAGRTSICCSPSISNSDYPGVDGTFYPSALNANITFYISDWGFGIFSSCNGRLKSFSLSDLQGVLMLETLATDLKSDNPKAFIPANYPMAILLSNASYGPVWYTNNQWAQAGYQVAIPMRIRTIMTGRLPLNDAKVSADAPNLLASLAYNLDGGTIQDAVTVQVNADGEQCAEIYPVFLRVKNTLLAKLPVMKPIVGSYRYVHIGKRLDIEDKVYFGISATHKDLSHVLPIIGNPQYMDIRLDGLKQEYLRIK
ncbi:hypothetical protein [Ewingella americana]|uniref:Uncharacterized protein n=1 Tax=Ewingella americana TaxID=41202 RepID=A0A502GDW4_9GAMM|nr:hypothetical protein [Ewingella americana]TPG59941.1 hypothetical protein EAH77_15350 [Ewingella americana]